MEKLKKLKNVNSFLKFNAESPTPFHCVSSLSSKLQKNGFKKLSLKNPKDFDQIIPNGKYFLTNNGSSLIAFALGGKYSSGSGATILAAHTDSPCLQAKPVSKGKSCGYKTFSVQTYGGGHFNSWFDRDLSVAGRVIIEKDTSYEAKLFQVKRPIMVIPRLAIHLHTLEEKKRGFKPNPETQLKAVLGTESKHEDAKKDQKDDRNTGWELSEQHSKGILDEIAKEAGEKVENFRGISIFLYDTQKPAIGGLKNEFIHAARLDNQMMSFVTIESLLESLKDEDNPLSEDTNIRMVVLFDNEEIGSISNRGADSRYLISVIERIVGKKNLSNCIEKSMVVSADMSHAVHPNYPNKCESNHQNHIGGGLVVKHSVGGSYATNDLSAFFFSEIAKKNNIPIQLSVPRQDIRSGSTVGPYVCGNLAVRTVDVGLTQWAMHSVRETCGVEDLDSSIRLLSRFLCEFPLMDAKIKVD